MFPNYIPRCKKRRILTKSNNLAWCVKASSLPYDSGRPHVNWRKKESFKS